MLAELPTTLRPWLECLNFVAGIAVAIIGALALQQIRILKRDIFLRNSRGAKEKAIEYCSRYLNEYCEKSHPFVAEYIDAKLKWYCGPVGDFSYESLQPEHKESAKQRFCLPSWLSSMNELEAIAAAFMSGVADERLGFEIIGRTFCVGVQLNYDILAWSRRAKTHAYYENIVRLYKLWAPRLSAAELQESRKQIENELASKPQNQIVPIGCE